MIHQRISYNKVVFAWIVVGVLLSAGPFCWGFQRPAAQRCRLVRPSTCSHFLPVLGMTGDDNNPKEESIDQDENVVEKQVIRRGTEQDEFSPEFWDELEAGQPSEWSVMTELLGINIFTYILAVAIAFFLSMNSIFGQGWLGSTLGIRGTGSFVERSEKLPNVVDLGDNQFSI